MIGPLAICYTVKAAIVTEWLRVSVGVVSHRLKGFMKLSVVCLQMIDRTRLLH